VAYKTTKAGMIAFTEQIACQNAEYGVRANAILPGLMNTPMAVDTAARDMGQAAREVEAMRERRVPLRKRMGTGWDVAYAALFLASDEANFITGIGLLAMAAAAAQGVMDRAAFVMAPALSHAEKALAEVRANTFSQASGRASIRVTRHEMEEANGSRHDPKVKPLVEKVRAMVREEIMPLEQSTRPRSARATAGPTPSGRRRFARA
jgi:hypothetical protein